MSKYKVGDKIVMEITKIFSDNFGTKDCIVKGFTRCGENCLSEHSELLSTYTLPLEDKIHKQATEITRLLAENKGLKEDKAVLNAKIDAYKLYGDQHEEEYNQAFNQGAEAAWELARKIVLKNGYSAYDLHEIFNCCGSHQALEGYTYSEAAAKVAEWERVKEEIKVGDVVRNKPHVSVEFCVTQIDYDGYLYGVGRGGATYSGKNPEYWEKTGRHIDIDSFLKQIRGEQE